MPLQTGNVLAVVTASIFGAVVASVLFLIEKQRQEKRCLKISNDVNRLAKELEATRREINEMKRHEQQQDNHKERRPPPPHRKRMVSQQNGRPGSSLSTSSTYNDTYVSAFDTDVSDSEFFDTNDSGTDNDSCAQKEFDEADLDEILAECDRRLPNIGDLELIVDHLVELRDQYPNRVKILWRLGRLYHYLCENPKRSIKMGDGDVDSSDNDLMSLVNKGIDVCNEAITLDQYHPEANKYLAILLGTKCHYGTTRTNFVDAPLFKRHLDQALELNAQDAYLHYLHGRYMYKLATLTWYEKQAAGFIIEIPSDPYQRALQSLEMADGLTHAPNRHYHLMIAKCHIGLDHMDEALKWLQTANEADKGEVDDVSTEIKSLLVKYSVSFD